MLDSAVEQLRAVPADADRMVEWADVVSVDCASEHPLQCPICLDDEPLSPQITLCGHVFCFPCIVRHLAGDADHPGGRAKGCPMCFGLVRVKDLRSVAHRHVAKPAAGEEAQFVLLERGKNSVVPSEVAPAGAAAAEPPPAAAEGAPRVGPKRGEKKRPDVIDAGTGRLINNNPR